jgi:hypothetical protein
VEGAFNNEEEDDLAIGVALSGIPHIIGFALLPVSDEVGLWNTPFKPVLAGAVKSSVSVIHYLLHNGLTQSTQKNR